MNAMAQTTLTPSGYRVTQLDRLWLLRAVQAEAHDATDRARVAQALVNRFAMLLARDPSLYPTLWGFVRSYARTVNPRWMEGGDKLDRVLQGTDGQVRKAILQAAERRSRNAQRTEFDASAEEAVDRALTLGPVDLPSPSVTDFTAPGSATPSHLVQATPHQDGRNTYYTLRRVDWPGYGVTQQGGDGSGSVGWLAAGAGLGLWFLAAKRRRRS